MRERQASFHLVSHHGVDQNKNAKANAALLQAQQHIVIVSFSNALSNEKILPTVQEDTLSRVPSQQMLLVQSPFHAVVAHRVVWVSLFFVVVAVLSLDFVRKCARDDEELKLDEEQASR